MGSCVSNQNKSPEEKQEDELNRRIDKDIRKLHEEEKKTRKLLLLGPGESGKSTLFRQSRIIFGNGFDSEELDHFKVIITSNMVDAMRELVRNVEPSLLVQDPKVKAAADFFSQEDDWVYPEYASPEMAEHVEILWNHAAIQEVFQKRNELKITVQQDNVTHFFENVRKISDPTYKLDTKDILFLRQATTGVVELKLYLDNQEITLLDVGGQRNERKKWIHHFDDCKAVLFVAAISEYDQVLTEDHATNRLQEALDLFEQICNLPFFDKVHMMLFLNKHDLFKDKIAKGIDPKTVCPKLFKDYEGTLNADDIVEYVIDLFALRNRVQERNVYCHVTCATDSNNVRQVFDIVYDILLNRALEVVM